MIAQQRCQPKEPARSGCGGGFILPACFVLPDDVRQTILLCFVKPVIHPRHGCRFLCIDRWNHSIHPIRSLSVVPVYQEALLAAW
ncbi:MAG TPA: hypothetical protein VGJ87_10060, partial [Roseiflexaceae bacterium]